MLIVILISSLAFVFGLLLGGSSVVLVFRKVFQDNSLQMNEYEKNIVRQSKLIKEIVYETNHYGGNPVLKRFRGLHNTTAPLWKSIRDNLFHAKKPGHHRYAELVENDINELEQTWLLSVKVAESLEHEILATVKKVEDLDL